jgi:IclR family pca regulon transcriptional regulator
VLLAHLPAEEIDDYLARAKFYPYTEHTMTSPRRLREALKNVCDNGFAFASQQMEPRLCTLAVPVRDSAGHYVAGINVILQGRLSSADDMAAKFFRPLHDAALELGSLLLP